MLALIVAPGQYVPPRMRRYSQIYRHAGDCRVCGSPIVSRFDQRSVRARANQRQYPSTPPRLAMLHGDPGVRSGPHIFVQQQGAMVRDHGWLRQYRPMPSFFAPERSSDPRALIGRSAFMPTTMAGGGPHTCRSHCPSGSAQLGGLPTFAGICSGDEIAPTPVSPRDR